MEWLSKCTSWFTEVLFWVHAHNQVEIHKKRDSLSRIDSSSRGTQQDVGVPFSVFPLSCRETWQSWQEEEEEEERKPGGDIKRGGQRHFGHLRLRHRRVEVIGGGLGLEKRWGGWGGLNSTSGSVPAGSPSALFQALFRPNVLIHPDCVEVQMTCTAIHTCHQECVR